MSSEKPSEVEAYGDWKIWYEPSPIESRSLDWQFAHKDFTEPHIDNRYGAEASREDCLKSIAFIEDMDHAFNEDEKDVLSVHLIKMRETLLLTNAFTLITSLLSVVDVEDITSEPIVGKAKLWLSEYASRNDIIALEQNK